MADTFRPETESSAAGPATDFDFPHEQVLRQPTFQMFWNRYSSRYEMPISLVLAAIAMVFTLFGLILGMVLLLSGGDKKPVPLAMYNGDDDSGEGDVNGGGSVPEPITKGNPKPTEEDLKNILPDLTTLPDIKLELTKQLNVDDPNGTVFVPDEKAYSYASLDDTIRKKMLGVGQTKGDGTGNGNPLGTGSDSSLARSMRWVMNFKTTSGRDYLNQLSALGAIVVVPMPPDFKQAYVYRDLINPKTGSLVDEREWTKLASQVRFCDYKKDSVGPVAKEFGLPDTVKSFWAFFPSKLEGELSKKEIAFQGRRSKDIEETTFQITVRGGQYDIVVIDQKLKK